MRFAVWAKIGEVTLQLPREIPFNKEDSQTVIAKKSVSASQQHSSLMAPDQLSKFLYPDQCEQKNYCLIYEHRSNLTMLQRGTGQSGHACVFVFLDSV